MEKHCTHNSLHVNKFNKHHMLSYMFLAFYFIFVVILILFTTFSLDFLDSFYIEFLTGKSHNMDLLNKPLLLLLLLLLKAASN